MPNGQADGQVIFEVVGKNQKMKQTLDDTTSAIEKESKKWDNAADSSANTIESKLLAAFKAVSIAAVASKVGDVLADWSKQAIQAASDLEEVQNVVDTTFGSDANKIEEWARKAGTQFGLTETQAKRFTSTLGAMMKSAGMAGPEIVQMSTDLAGLAADMASFYNLDFDTAFQKIRSGISGETEPLKQLGINMSVANLEAYALQQGLSKTFDQMTQGEQTMLRYQYLMQATSDAQGDFARTSDGYANSMRLLETNIESLKTKFGQVLIPVISDAVSALNGFLEKISSDNTPRSVLDDFAEIKLNTAQKLGEIEATANEARVLIDTLGAIEKTSSELTSSKVGELAQALELPAGASADRWGTLLSTIAENLPAVSDATSVDFSSPSVLKRLGEAASSLGLGYSSMWDQFLTVMGDKAGPAISALAGGSDSAKALKDLADALELKTGISATKWSDLFTAISDNLPGMTGALNDSGDDAARIKAIADAMELKTGISATRWTNLFTAISDNLPDVTAATSRDYSTARFLEKASEAAASLGGDYSEMWESLLSAIGDNVGPVVEALSGAYGVGTRIGEIADGAKKIDTTSVNDWQRFLRALGNQTGITSLKANASGAAGGITELAEALSGTSEQMTQGEAFVALIGTLKDNASALSELTGSGADETKAWLESLAEGANTLDPTKADGWGALIDSLVNGLPGLTLGGDSSALFAALMGGATNAEQNLQALGAETDSITDKQAAWLSVCRQLVQTIPGLSSIIDTQTGEIQGGIGMLRLYVDEWQAAQEKTAILEAYNERNEAIIKRRAELQAIAVQKLIEANKFNQMAADGASDKALDEQLRNIQKLNDEYETLSKDIDTATQEYEDGLKAIEEMYGPVDSLTTAMNEQAEATKAAAQAATAELSPALQELTDYYKNVYDATKQSIDSTVKGFERIITPAQKARDEMDKLTAANLRYNEDGTLNINYSSLENSIPTVRNMTKALQEQLDYINEYNANLERAAALGVNKDLLASLSDGSVESADYLAALASANEDEIKALNDAYEAVNAGKSTFTDALTAQKLAADETFEGIAAKANEMVTALDVSEEAKDALASTIEGMANGIAAALPELQTQIDNVMAQLERLSVDGGFSIYGGGISLGGGGGSGLTYDLLSSAIKSSVPSGSGNVYLDGRSVGKVLSKAQGAAYTAAERSGTNTP